MKNRVNASHGFVNPNSIQTSELTELVLDYLEKNGFKPKKVYDLYGGKEYPQYESLLDCKEFLEIVEGFPEINTSYKRPDMKLIKDKGILIQPSFSDIEIDYTWNPTGIRHLFSRIEMSSEGSSLVITSKRQSKLFNIHDSPIYSIKLSSRRIE